jgi:hypothetical protein
MSPGALPNAPPIAFGGTLPAFTPSSVRAVHMPQGAPGYMQPPSLGNVRPPPINAAPTLRSSERGVLIFIVVFLVSLVALLWLAWRFVFT